MNNVAIFETPVALLGNVFQRSYEGFLGDMYDLLNGVYDDTCVVSGTKEGLSPESLHALKRYAFKNRLNIGELVEEGVFPLPDGQYAYIYCSELIEWRVSSLLEGISEDFRINIKKKSFYDSFFRYISKNLSASASLGSFRDFQRIALDLSKETMHFFGVPYSAWNTEGGKLWRESLNGALAKRYYARRAVRLRRTSFGY